MTSGRGESCWRYRSCQGRVKCGDVRGTFGECSLGHGHGAVPGTEF